MKQIIFRGRDEKGTWRYGYIFVTKESDLDKAIIWDNELDSPISVDATTIGQFIGIEDDKWHKIFEGDILEVFHGDNKTYKITADMWNAREHQLDSGATFDVIGNIYDNPELATNI